MGHRRGLFPSDITTSTGVEAFQFDDSEYADDCMLAFKSRAVMEKILPPLYTHFDKFGMEIHAAPEGKAEDSKSEAMYIPSPPTTYEFIDLKSCMDRGREVKVPVEGSEDDVPVLDSSDSNDDIDWTEWRNTTPTYVSAPELDDDGNEIRPANRVDFSEVKVGGGKAVPVVFEFVYLGRKVHSSCSDEPDVDARIAKASKAFGALSKAVFRNKQVSSYSKGVAYKVLVLTVLLYGCESWSLTQRSWAKLRLFHNDKTRQMCDTTTVKQWKTRGLTCAVLRNQLSISEIESYVYKRSLAWLGHVAGMSMHRMPRKMLSSWVAAERTSGGQKITYGKQIQNALRYVGIDTDNKHVSTAWPEMVRDGKWAAMVEKVDEIHASLSPDQKGAAAAGSSPLRTAGTADWDPAEKAAEAAAAATATAAAEELVGCTFSRCFRRGIFVGKVTGYDAKNQWWRVEYTDGETEDFNVHECRKHGLGLTTEEQAEEAFVCDDDSCDSPSLNDSSDNTTEEGGSETDGSEPEERRARVRAASEVHSPRATNSRRATRKPVRYGTYEKVV